MEKFINGFIVENLDDIKENQRYLDFIEENEEKWENEFPLYDENELTYFVNTIENDIYIVDNYITTDNMTFFKLKENELSSLFFDYENFLAHCNLLEVTINDIIYKIPYCKDANIYELIDEELYQFENELKNILLDITESHDHVWSKVWVKKIEYISPFYQKESIYNL